MGYKFVDITENDSGDALVSEIIGIPLLMRGDSNTPLLKQTLSESLGLPLLTNSDKPVSTLSSSKPFSKLMSGTIFGRLGIPEIWK